MMLWGNRDPHSKGCKMVHTAGSELGLSLSKTQVHAPNVPRTAPRSIYHHFLQNKVGTEFCISVLGPLLGDGLNKLW